MDKDQLKLQLEYALREMADYIRTHDIADFESIPLQFHKHMFLDQWKQVGESKDFEVEILELKLDVRTRKVR